MNPKGCPSPGETLLSLLKEASQNRLEALKATGTAGWAVDWADFGILVFHDFPLICGFQSVFLLIQDFFRHFGPHFAAFSQGIVPSSRWAVGPLARGRHGGDRGVLRNFGGRAGDAETGGLGAGFTERCDAL